MCFFYFLNLQEDSNRRGTQQPNVVKLLLKIKKIKHKPSINSFLLQKIYRLVTLLNFLRLTNKRVKLKVYVEREEGRKQLYHHHLYSREYI